MRPRAKVDSYSRHREQLSAPWDVVLRRFGELRTKDATAESRSRSLFIALLVLFGLGFLFLVLTGPALERWDLPRAILLFPLGLIIAGLVVTVVRLVVRRGDMDDRKLAFVPTLLAPLRRELDAKRPVSLDLDFSRADQGGTKVQDEKEGPNIRNQRWQHGWLTLSFQLLDGTQVEIGVTSDHKQKRVRKVARKVKVKYKNRQAGLVEITLVPPKGKQLMGGIRHRMTTPHGLTLVGGLVTPRRARLRWRSMPERWVKRRGYVHGVSGGPLPTGEAALFALMVSYKLVAAAQQRAA